QFFLDMGHLRLVIGKGAAGGEVDGLLAGIFLPASNRCIHVKRINLDTAAEATGALAGHQCRAAAHEWIEHDGTAVRAVEDGVGQHLDRLHRRMNLEEITLLPAASEVINSSIWQDIGPVATEFAEQNIIDVRCIAVLEDEGELVLAAI